MILSALLALASPAAAASISGEVTGTNGAPIAGASVAAINPWFSAVRTTTDADGQYTISELDPGDYRIGVAPPQDDPHLVRYFPDGRSYCDGTSIRLYPETDRVGVDLNLTTGARLTGILTDQDGEPVAGAGVSASGISGISARRSTTTHEDGSFILTGLDVADGGDSDWLVKIAVSGWPVQFLGPTYETAQATAFSVNARGTTDLGEHRLLDGIMVGGQVHDDAGPVADATVRVYSAGQLIQTSTDPSGAYEVVGLPPGDVFAWAAADGRGVTYLPDADRPTESLVVEEGDSSDDGDIEMPAEARFTVSLQADASADLSEVAILLYNDTHTVGRGANSDAAGTAVIDQLHGGEYHLFVYGADAGLADAWVREQSGDLRVFTVEDATDMPAAIVELLPSVRIEGDVIDEEGVPVANAAIIASPPESGPLEDAENSFFTHTDGTGHFTLSGLPAGQWRVRAYVEPRCPADPGFVPVYWPQQVNPARWEAADLTPEAGTHWVRFELPLDDDKDLMGDRWERRHGLDDSINDSTFDPDEDGLSNLDEYRLGRDPQVADGEWITVPGCACASAPAGGVLWLLPLGLIARRRAAPTCLKSAP